MKNEYILNEDGTAFVFTNYSDGKLKSCYWVDQDDLEKISIRKWHTEHQGYGCAKLGGNKIKMHRFLLDAEKGQIVDHINRDVADNRRINLRFASRSENNQNCFRLNINKTGYKGVSRKERANGHTFVASIGYKNKTIHLGYFSCAEYAAVAYNTAAKILYGNDTYLNPIN